MNIDLGLLLFYCFFTGCVLFGFSLLFDMTRITQIFIGRIFHKEDKEL